LYEVFALAANQTSKCERNAQQSPLLQLPVEVRKRIYELVIGGHHIQLGYKPHEHRRRTKNKQRYNEHTPGGLWYFCAPTQPPNDGYALWAWDRFGSRPSHLPAPFEWEERYNDGPTVTTLARVCRQLHQDTSLLIYEMNMFSFANAWTMRRWLQTLKPVQIRAMRRLYVSQPLTSRASETDDRAARAFHIQL